MKEKECPNCGGAEFQVLSEGEYRCKFCGTNFQDKNIIQQKVANERKTKHAQVQELKYQAQLAQAKASGSMTKKILLFVFAMLMIIFGAIVYMGKQSLDENAKNQQELIKSFQPNSSN